MKPLRVNAASVVLASTFLCSIACRSLTPVSQPNIASISSEADQAYESKRFSACAAGYEKAAQLQSTRQAFFLYNAACCYALDKRPAEAVRLLQSAIDKGFKDPKRLESDADLNALKTEAAWAGLVAKAASAEAKHQSSLNAELLALYQADQADRLGNNPEKINWAEVSPRDAQRRARVSEIVASGGAKVSDDFFHAAMVFQHGDSLKDYERAYELALKSTQLSPSHERSRWLTAAALDRKLLNEGKPQRYGTQFSMVGGKLKLSPFDPTVTDSERAEWDVPSLAQSRARETH
jgi:hypothetical protein